MYSGYRCSMLLFDFQVAGEEVEIDALSDRLAGCVGLGSCILFDPTRAG